MNKDDAHLKWLSIGFYINAVVYALFVGLMFVYLYFGAAIASGSYVLEKNSPPPAAGWLFIGLALIFILSGTILTVCTFLTGKYLKQQTNYVFCFIIAAVNCATTPIGLILGILTIIVLLRDSVKGLFDKHQNFSQYTTPPSWQ